MGYTGENGRPSDAQDLGGETQEGLLGWNWEGSWLVEGLGKSWESSLSFFLP